MPLVKARFSAQRAADPVREAEALFHEGEVSGVFLQKAVVLDGLFPDQEGVAGNGIGSLVFPSGHAVRPGKILLLAWYSRQPDGEAAPGGREVGPASGRTAPDADGIKELVGFGTIDIIVVAAHFEYPDLIRGNENVVALQVAPARAACDVVPLVAAAGGLRLLLDLSGDVLIQEAVDLPENGIILFTKKAAVGADPADHIVRAVAHVRILPGVVDAV